ncbi:hypothetical protein PsorP6_013959 [Peronosclerospora sorghi]|uniref:Uncharacterized protein n=1 Tax=Peronosclerospora sorghi TaxID=230839 RepID=A0ACC0VG86_9STRA|nr:hypothetical protein PsorP6_013959 [Peronosclerospora sorghi]
MVRARTPKKRQQRPPLAPRYQRQRETEAKETVEKSKSPPPAQQTQRVRELFTRATCRCFVLKSFSEANFHKSLKFGIWSTTHLHHALLDDVYQSDMTAVRPILLFFSVCGTKHFSGVARMTSGVITGKQFVLWEKLKYEGFFHVEWLLVKDVPNYVLTGIKMSNTPSKKSITTCRDCDEVLFEEAYTFLSIFTDFDSSSSAWDDFTYYDELQRTLERKRGLSLDGDKHLGLDSYLVSKDEPVSI